VTEIGFIAEKRGCAKACRKRSLFRCDLPAVERGRDSTDVIESEARRSRDAALMLRPAIDQLWIAALRSR
jgi:hypothetical protein